MGELFRVTIADIVNPRRRTGRRPAIRRSLVGKAQDDPGYIIDIGKVAPHPAMVKELDRSALEDRLGEQEHRHIGPSPRPVDGEKPQTCYRKTIEVAIGMRDQ